MSESVDFEALLRKAVQVPLVGVDREQFLQCELGLRYDSETVATAIRHNPAYAGIPVDQIAPIAEACIGYEASHVTALSAAAGVPGGLAMAGTLPADMVQYLAHLLRVMQKLAYLYGWPEIDARSTGVDQEAESLLTLFAGVMFGVAAANQGINIVAAQMAERMAKKLARQALTKGAVYPVVKKVAIALGFRMTKEIFANGVAKVVPVVGAVTSGALTYATYRPMACRLRDHLSSLQIADPAYYGSAIVEPTGTVGRQSIEVMADQAMQTASKALGDAVSIVADGGARIADQAGTNMKKAADSAAPVVAKAAEGAGHALADAGQAIGKTGKAAGTAVVNTVNGAGAALGDAGKAIGGAIGDLFGGKRK